MIVSSNTEISRKFLGDKLVQPDETDSSLVSTRIAYPTPLARVIFA